jgi:hypothetical protein
MKVLWNLTVFSLLLGAPGSAIGKETFELFNGGQIRGELLNPDESPRSTYQIRLPQGDLITLSSAQVKRVAGKSEAQIWYETWIPKIPEGIEGHLKMAAACKERGLEAERFYHLHQVLEANSDHEEARRALGYSKINGEWTRTDIWYRERGFVRHKGKWRVPQEIELEERQLEQEEEELAWARQIRLWRSWVTKRRSLARDGLVNLASIDDPRAASTIADLLNEKDEPRELRRIYVEVLGRLPVSVSTLALARRVLVDDDEHVRDRALEYLVKRQDRGATQLFISSLKNSNNLIVNRAAVALNHMQDREAILPLIDALSTKHKFLVGGGGGELNPTFSSDPSLGGLGGLSMGNKPQIIIQDIQNVAARDALVSLTAGANFGFNKEAWKTWYSQQNVPVQVNLRRDP